MVAMAEMSCDAKDAFGTVLAAGDYVTTAELNQYRIKRIEEGDFHIVHLLVEDRGGRCIKMLPFLTLKCGRQAWYE